MKYYMIFFYFFIYLFESQKKLPSADLLPKCPQSSKIGSQELNPDLPCGCQESNFSGPYLCLSGYALAESWS